jgi:DNA-binding NtrC family response regulator
MKELFDIYLVDDEQVAREGIALALKKRYQIKTFASGEELVEAVLSSTPDMILLDIGLPGMTGVEVLGKIKEMYPEIIVIMITAYEDIDTVVTAMKKGAYDYIVKPVQIESLLVTVKNALETIRLRKEIQLLHEKVLKENVPGFIGESDAMQDVMETVAKVVKSPDTSILILGETGTGKRVDRQGHPLPESELRGAPSQCELCRHS